MTWLRETWFYWAGILLFWWLGFIAGWFSHRYRAGEGDRKRNANLTDETINKYIG